MLGLGRGSNHVKSVIPVQQRRAANGAGCCSGCTYDVVLEFIANQKKKRKAREKKEKKERKKKKEKKRKEIPGEGIPCEWLP